MTHHFIVVAGVPGAGKTTFVEEFVQGRLPADVASYLPNASARWKRIRPRDRQGWIPHPTESFKRQMEQGLLIEYDMVSNAVLKGTGGLSDREIPILMRHAQKVTVVNLRPSAELLSRQLKSRDSVDWVRSFPKFLEYGFVLNKLMLNATRHFQGRVGASLNGWLSKGRRSLGRRISLPIKLARYSEPGWLEALYAQWDEYLRSLEARGISVTTLVLVRNEPHDRWMVVS